MGNLTIAPGHIELVNGSYKQAAILGILLKRVGEYGPGDENEIKVKHLAERLSCSEVETVNLLADLGCVEIEGDSLFDDEDQPLRGRKVYVEKLVLRLQVTQSDQPSLPGTNSVPMAPIRRPGRLQLLERDPVEVGGTLYRGEITPTYTSDLNDEYASCTLTISSREEGEEEWRLDVLDQPFEGPACVTDAWMWFEEKVGWEPGILEWADDHHPQIKPLLLEGPTFEALVEAFQQIKPDDKDRMAACADAIDRGQLVIETRGDRLIFRADAGGMKWPGLRDEDDSESGPGDAA